MIRLQVARIPKFGMDKYFNVAYRVKFIKTNTAIDADNLIGIEVIVRLKILANTKKFKLL